MTDETTRHLYRIILAGVRRSRPVGFRFRCDSPDRRRLMTVHVTAAPDGGVAFRSDVVSVEDRPPERLLDPLADRSGDLLRVCSWCARLHVGQEWADVEDAAARLRLFENARLPRLTHGVCEQCFAEPTA